MSDLEALAKLASEATPGPWGDDFGIRTIAGELAGGSVVVAVAVENEDAAYISAASPDVVLALVKVALAAQEVEHSALLTEFGADVEFWTVHSAALARLRAALAGLIEKT